MSAVSSVCRRVGQCFSLRAASGFASSNPSPQRTAHVERLLHANVPHEDDSFVRNLLSSVSSQELEDIWAVIGLASASPSLKHVSKGVERLCNDPKQSLKLCTIAFRSRYLQEQVYKGIMMELYAKAGFLQHANSMLQSSLAGGYIPPMDAWQSLVQSGKDRRQPLFVQELVSDMESHDITPPKKILKLLMDTYADGRMPKEALETLDLMRQRGMFVDAHAYAVCVKALIGSKESIETLDALVNDIKKHLGKTPHRLWTTILMAYASMGNIGKVISIADDMVADGMHLNERDLTALLRACREADDVERGQEMLRRVEAVGYTEEVSLATEMIRLYDMCGNTERSLEVFHEVIKSNNKLDKGIFNILIDIFMNHWSEATNAAAEEWYKSQAKIAFDIGWARGIFGHTKPSQKGQTLHVDLHRSGLWASQFIIMKSIDEETQRYFSGKRIRAIKYITGKGQSSHSSRKISLADVVRAFLYRSGITYQEDSLGIFNVPKRSLDRMSKAATTSRYAPIDPRILR